MCEWVFGAAVPDGSKHYTPQTLRVCFATQQSWVLMGPLVAQQGLALPARVAKSIDFAKSD
ncbi:MAG: hypothetical protein A3H42_06370 [Deltaproteobacteria bacterium RIFCSPLOWO2_02_FULL_46_8]|nr:MAG: hypothetical protein A3H42_06370 [Deltaproteobacteria bacterium RIFCSPLOWO2_02_FULL_46_8]